MNVYLLGALLAVVVMMSAPDVITGSSQDYVNVKRYLEKRDSPQPQPASFCALAGSTCDYMKCCPNQTPPQTCYHDPDNETNTCMDICTGVVDAVAYKKRSSFIAAVCAEDRTACDNTHCCPDLTLSCIHNPENGHDSCRTFADMCS